MLLRFVAVRGRRILVRREGARARLAELDSEWVGELSVEHYPLGLAESPELRVAELRPEAPEPEGGTLEPVRELLSVLPEAEAARALRALHVAEWGRSHRFCGRCGARYPALGSELVRSCSACDAQLFPRISPAVIVLVRRGEQVLLGRGNHLPAGLFSTLAGFVDPGESLEEAVHRELFEEVGIEVSDVRYFGSQPWPFPDSLMVGFTAEHAAGELRVDRDELAEARWFGRDELPPVPPAFSIARRLIDAWVRERGGDPELLRSWPG